MQSVAGPFRFGLALAGLVVVAGACSAVIAFDSSPYVSVDPLPIPP